MKRVIVPFFIVHQGCPHRCVFCDQRAISGSEGSLPQPAEILRTIDAWCSSSGTKTVEVAFYGGTFTSLSAEQQQGLLLPLKPLLESGCVSAVRVSTRPDAVDAAAAKMLADNGVSLVELGVQSMHDEVLAACGRGHCAADTVTAFTILKSAGLKVGAQMMPGLPGDSMEGAIASFKRLLALKPDLLRIYPAVVLKGTELAKMYLQGSYKPLSLEDAVSICKMMLHEAALAGVPVIRVGLQPTNDLAGGTVILAGPFHAALRQLAEGERWYDLLRNLVAGFDEDCNLTIHVPPARVSDLVGQKRCNIVRLKRISGKTVAGVFADSSLAADQIRISDSRRIISGNILRDLSYAREL